jgi:phosphoglycolate phosphatase
MPNAILFDFDLTLVDSAAAVVECANYALRAMNHPEKSHAEIVATIGLPPRETFPLFTNESDPRLADQYLTHWVARADQVTLGLVDFYAPVPPLLAELRKRNIRTGIVSTRFRYRIEAILAHRRLAHSFDIIIGGEDVATHKPDPQGLRLAIAKLNAPTADVIYVGDHVVDAQAAARAGVGFVGVLTGQSTRESLALHGARRVLDSLAELPAMLDANGFGFCKAQA